MKKLLFLLIIIVCSQSAWSHDFEVANSDGVTIYYNKISSSTVEVTYKGRDFNSFDNEYTGNVSIPSTVTSSGITYSVISIGTGAFFQCGELTSVTIPSSVASIGSCAFQSCNGLASVCITDLASWCAIEFSELNSNPLLYANHLFLNNKEITDLVIPDTVTLIGNYAFENCKSLTSVTIPHSVTSIGAHSFRDCIDLTLVNIPNSVTSISECAFLGCSGLTEVTIPNSVTSIGNFVFSGCIGLTAINIPHSVTSIGTGAFMNCTGLTSVTIPETVTSIGARTFYGCSGLNSVTIPNSVTYISDYTFYGCNNLIGFNIPDSVTNIGDAAFMGCSNLTSLTIPNTVLTIGKQAFKNCVSIKELVIEDGDNELSLLEDNNSYLPFMNCHIQSIYIGRDLSSWENLCNILFLYEANIGQKVTTIGKSAFKGCCYLKTLHIEDGENLLTLFFSDSELYPFKGCYVEDLYIGRDLSSWIALCSSSHLKKLVVGNSVNSIGYAAFYNCTGLTSVTLGNSVTSIENSAFYYCKSLTSLTIPDSVTSIGSGAFYGCIGLTSLTVGNSVTSIGGWAFFSCNRLPEVTIPSSVTSIGYSAFYGCSSLKTLHVDESDIELSLLFDITSQSVHYPFDDCAVENLYVGRNLSSWEALCLSSSLKEVEIGNSVTSIGAGAFSYCTSLNSVTIPNSVTSIEQCAFWKCTGLTSVTIPNSVSLIDNSAFQNCSGLKTLCIEDCDKELNLYSSDYSDDYPFYGCKIENLYVGRNLSSWQALCNSSNLKEAGIGDFVTSIGYEAFRSCSGLTSFVIPNSVTSIGASAFLNCSSLNLVTVKSEIPPIGDTSVFDQRTYNICSLVVPDGSLSVYKAATPWEHFYNIKEAEEAGIDDIAVDIIKDAKGKDIYSINGICLKRNACQEDILNLSRGFYIINGKVVQIK